MLTLRQKGNQNEKSIPSLHSLRTRFAAIPGRKPTINVANEMKVVFSF